MRVALAGSISMVSVTRQSALIVTRFTPRQTTTSDGASGVADESEQRSTRTGASHERLRITTAMHRKRCQQHNARNAADDCCSEPSVDAMRAGKAWRFSVVSSMKTEEAKTVAKNKDCDFGRPLGVVVDGVRERHLNRSVVCGRSPGFQRHPRRLRAARRPLSPTLRIDTLGLRHPTGAIDRRSPARPLFLTATLIDGRRGPHHITEATCPSANSSFSAFSAKPSRPG